MYIRLSVGSLLPWDPHLPCDPASVVLFSMSAMAHLDRFVEGVAHFAPLPILWFADSQSLGVSVDIEVCGIKS
jgi:hypothetical protein